MDCLLPQTRQKLLSLSLFFFPRSHGQTAWRGKTCNFTICILSSLPRKMHFCFTVLPFCELSQSWREQKCGKSIFQLWTQPWRWLFCANEKWHKHPTAAYFDLAGKKIARKKYKKCILSTATSDTNVYCTTASGLWPLYTYSSLSHVYYTPGLGENWRKKTY